LSGREERAKQAKGKYSFYFFTYLWHHGALINTRMLNSRQGCNRLLPPAVSLVGESKQKKIETIFPLSLFCSLLSSGQAKDRN